MRVAIVLGLLFLTGCVGSTTKYVDGAKIEEVYSIGIFTPTVQMTRMSKCAQKKVEHDGGEYGTPWTETKTMEPCQVLGTKKDGFMNSTSGPLAPVFLQGATTVGAAALISDGLRNQNVSPGDNVNINNRNSQAQGQSQRSYNSNNLSTCQGNCGPRRGWGR